MEAVSRLVTRFFKGAGATVFVVVGALVVGFGVPLLWLWLASLLQGDTGAVSGGLAAFIAVGIISTYAVIVVVASYLRGFLIRSDPEKARPRRDPWTTSMRDERPTTRARSGSDPVEALFVVATVIVGIAFLIWFAFFAGAPIPAT